LPSSKYCKFHLLDNSTSLNDINSVINNDKALSFCRLKFDKDSLKLYTEKMIEFQPVWLFGGAKSWYDIAKFITANNYKPPRSIKYIECSGSEFPESCRKRLEETFQCPVVNHYGCTETYGIAVECPKGNLHCLGNNVVVEVLKDGKVAEYGEEGEIAITGLNNYAMPFIRYVLGDIGTLYPASICSCGNKNPIIKVRAGRVSDLVFFNDREPLSSSIFYYAIERLNRLDGFLILQSKVIQEGFTEFRILLELDKNQKSYEVKIRERFLEEMAKFNLDKMDWCFEFV
jgi:phenylacetate-CoA ligase